MDEKELKSSSVREALGARSQEFLRFFQSIVHSPVDAEDLFQSGSIRALERSEEIKDVAKTHSWMLSIFRNLALDFLRKKQKLGASISSLESETIENIPNPAQEYSSAITCDCGTELLGEIPEHYSALLKKIEIEGSSVKQAAKELGTSPGNVSVRLHRARESLKHAVQEHCQVQTLDDCLDCDCKD